MATLGFKRAAVGVLNEAEGTVEVYQFDASEGGTISASITGLGSTLSTMYASNVPFFVSGQGVSSPKLELNVADLPEEALNAILGVETGEDGIAKITSTTKAPYVAVLLETDGKDGDSIYIGMTKGKMSYPDVSLNTGTESGRELNTDTISGDFIARKDDIVYMKGRSSAAGFTPETFKTLLFKNYTEPVETPEG